MTLKEQIVEKVQNLSENQLSEVNDFLAKFEENSELNALAKLRNIRISAAPDFSATAEIYPTVKRDAK